MTTITETTETVPAGTAAEPKATQKPSAKAQPAPSL